MKLRLLTAAWVLPLALTGCGDDGDDTSSGSDEPTETLPPEEAAVRDALVASLLDPDCDLLTDDYLLELAFLSDTVDEACEERMNVWVEPQFDEDDILISDIAVDGDVATAVVGSEYVNIRTRYELTLVDGNWLVSCDEFNCDDLESASPEVS